MNIINPNYSGRRENDKWERLDEKVLKAHHKIDEKMAEGEIDSTSGRIKQQIILEGGYIAKAKILSEEGRCLEEVAEMVAHTRMCFDSVCGILFEKTKLDVTKALEIQNNSLAIKAKRIYEIGESNIIKFFRPQYEK